MEKIENKPPSTNLTRFRMVSETTVSLYDIQGRMVSSEKRDSQNGIITINISSFENRIYFAKISSVENSVIKRLVKN